MRKLEHLRTICACLILIVQIIYVVHLLGGNLVDIVLILLGVTLLIVSILKRTNTPKPKKKAPKKRKKK